jgi:hypothetical protein
MIRLIRQRLAQRRLARDVERRKNAYETRRYCERRAAALKGVRPSSSRACTRDLTEGRA